MPDIHEAVKQAANAPGSRVSLGGENPTFGRLKTPTLLPSLVPNVPADRLSFASVDLDLTGDATVVAPGSQKPSVLSVTVSQRVVGKTAAVASINSEDFWESESVVEAVIQTLLSACLVAEDTKANADMLAATGPATPGTDWVAAISGGQAAVAAAGGSPNLLVVPSVAWPSLAGELASSTGLVTSSGDAIASVLGSQIVLTPKGTTAFVLDPNGLVRVVRDQGFVVSPIVSTNKFEIAVDVVSSTFVQSPAVLAAVAGPAGP